MQYLLELTTLWYSQFQTRECKKSNTDKWGDSYFVGFKTMLIKNLHKKVE